MPTLQQTFQLLDGVIMSTFEAFQIVGLLLALAAVVSIMKPWDID
jgi:hypothetical protein